MANTASELARKACGCFQCSPPNPESCDVAKRVEQAITTAQDEARREEREADCKVVCEHCAAGCVVLGWVHPRIDLPGVVIIDAECVRPQPYGGARDRQASRAYQGGRCFLLLPVVPRPSGGLLYVPMPSQRHGS